jgi:hypothetical protein
LSKKNLLHHGSNFSFRDERRCTLIAFFSMNIILLLIFYYQDFKKSLSFSVADETIG